MIQVFSQTHERLCLLQGYKSLAVKKKLADGDKELSFQYPRNGADAGYLTNECYILTQEDEFVLKEISGGKQWRKYTAILNLEDLKGKSFVSFEAVEKTVRQCLEEAFSGTGWSVGQCQIQKRRTIRKDNVCTVLDIINQCIRTYKIEIEYHSREKIMDVYEQIGSDKGVYFMEAVNLRQSPSFSSSSNGLYTQLRPIGKDGLRIHVNGGRDYIENHSYSPKDIMLTWKDERYTVESSLLEDATLKLEELCRPSVTYEADVIDLAKSSLEYREILSYGIGDMVTLVAKTDTIKEKMRITVITEYPETPEKNTCQLSTAKKTFADIQQELKEEAVQEATAAAAANTSKKIETESGTQSEAVNQKLDGMKTELLQNLREQFALKEEAKQFADSSLSGAKQYTDEKLEDYITGMQQERSLADMKEEIQDVISETYATKAQMNEVIVQLEKLTEEWKNHGDEADNGYSD